MMLLTQLLDVIVIVAIAMVVYPVAGRTQGWLPPHYIVGAGMVAAISHISFYQACLYEMDSLLDPARSIRTLFWRWTVVFIMLAALAALVHAPNLYSRLWFAGFYVGGFAAIGIERCLVARLIKAWIARGHHTLCVAIVGGNLLSERLIERFRDNPWGIRIVGVFDDRHRDNVAHISGVQLLGTIADLLEYSKIHEVDTVVVTLPISGSDRIRAIIRQLRQLPVNVRVLPGAIGLERISPIRLARTELPGVQLIAVADRPISEVALFAKDVLDRAFAAAALLAGAPILLFCIVGIKLCSPGPVLFRQTRVGYKGRHFNILKFRTMHIAACGNSLLTQYNDPRVFKFGSLLRKLSLDELPQLVNVLQGDMSLVGPRPHMPEARAGDALYFDAVSEYADRQRVKPGITGWAQVNGWRGPTETLKQIERRVEHDIYYIENWSLILDLVIIVKTVLVGFHGTNAF